MFSSVTGYFTVKIMVEMTWKFAVCCPWLERIHCPVKWKSGRENWALLPPLQDLSLKFPSEFTINFPLHREPLTSWAALDYKSWRLSPPSPSTECVKSRVPLTHVWHLSNIFIDYLEISCIIPWSHYHNVTHYHKDISNKTQVTGVNLRC